MNRTIFAAALLTGLVAAGPAGAQPVVAGTAQQPAAAAPVDELSARDTQQRLEQLLRDYPPSLRRVLQLDPALLDQRSLSGAVSSPRRCSSPSIPDIVHHAVVLPGPAR